MTLPYQTPRELRKNQTEAETVFWDNVRSRKFENKKFLRQYPICFEFENQKRFFIADFYCNEEKLIIEIDGKVHEKQRERDQFRTYLLNILGYQIIRFKNEEVITDMKGVLSKLKELIL